VFEKDRASVGVKNKVPWRVEKRPQVSGIGVHSIKKRKRKQKGRKGETQR